MNNWCHSECPDPWLAKDADVMQELHFCRNLDKYNHRKVPDNVNLVNSPYWLYFPDDKATKIAIIVCPGVFTNIIELQNYFGSEKGNS